MRMSLATASIRKPLKSGGLRARSVFELAGFFLQHDRDAVADRVGEPGRARDQFLLRPVVFEPPLGDGADQNFQELRIDFCRFVHGKTFMGLGFNFCHYRAVAPGDDRKQRPYPLP